MDREQTATGSQGRYEQELGRTWFVQASYEGGLQGQVRRVRVPGEMESL